MADEKDKKEEPAKKQTDFIAQIGRNFNRTNATEIFGEERALQALRAAARAGGHGTVSDADFKNPFWGGLQIPDPAAVEGETDEDNARRELYKKHRVNINAALNAIK